MKIVIMGNNEGMGGLQVHYEYLAKFLHRNNFDITCINVNDTHKKLFKNKEVTEINIPYRPSTYISKILKVFKLINLALQLRKLNPDVFIATGLGNGYNLVSFILKASTFKISQEVIFDAQLDPLRKKTTKVFDAVAVQTSSMIANYKKNVTDNIPLNYLPCFTRKLEAIFDLHKAETNTIRLCYFGRLASNKGLVEFINNNSAIFFGKNIILDIYGKGSEYSNIEKSISNNSLLDKIVLKGFYSDEDFSKLVLNYDACILPSTNSEGLPLILLEYMFYGKPVFASKMGAIPELGEKNSGIFLSEYDTVSQSENFKQFIELLIINFYDSNAIKNVYNENYSNECFEITWNNMLNNPKQYFK
jgi:glycosyltransferase involved in cell wall biosynthesis